MPPPGEFIFMLIFIAVGVVIGVTASYLRERKSLKKLVIDHKAEIGKWASRLGRQKKVYDSMYESLKHLEKEYSHLKGRVKTAWKALDEVKQ